MPRVRSRRTGNASIQVIAVENPGKGINNFVSDSLIDDKESPDSMNIQIDESGVVKKRNGYSTTGASIGSATAILGLGTYYVGTSTKENIAVYATGVYKRTSGSTNFALISGVTLTSGLQANLTQASDTSTTGALYVHNGTDAMTKYNGTVLSQPGTGIIGKFGINYLRRHFVAGNSSNPSKVYYSAADDGDNLANSITIGGNDGQIITGLAKFQNNLIVFKERSIYQFTFDSAGTPVIVQINASVGCVEHRSIDNVENDVFFLSRKGVYVLGNEPNFFDTIRTNQLSIRVQPTIDTISTSNFSKCSAFYYNNRYHLSIPSGGTTVNNRTLVYDKRYLAWEIWDGVVGSCWSEYIDSSSVSHLYFGSTSIGQVFEHDANFTDNGSAISAYWYSKNYDLGDGSVQKQFIWIDVFFRQVVGTVTIEIIIDGETIVKTVNLSNTSNVSDGWASLGWAGYGWASSSGATSSVLVSSNTPYRIPLNKKGRLIKIKVSNARNNETFSLLKYSIAIRPYGRFTFPSNLKLN